MNLLAYIYWNLSPEIFRLGNISVRWYGLLFALGFIVGYKIMDWIFKKEMKKETYLDTLAVYMIIATVVGARLGHCFFYEPQYYLSDPIKILYVWEGGLASHGAAIGIVIALWLFSRRRLGITYLWTLDRIVIVIALAGAFIRLGNFFNSEIYGMPADLPWAFIFAKVDQIPRHPTQLYEAISYILIFLFLLFRYKKLGAKVPAGLFLGYFLVLVFGARFFIEFFKDYQAAFERTLPIKMGQILSIPCVLIGLYFIFRKRISAK
jgi:phosphatidylglycerol---prolipoprotein diacylglyceryl transferase